MVTPELARRHRDLALLTIALTVCRLVAARFVPLTEDEAYYRLWAQHLHLGYYDHPPMIAWWIRAGESVFGDTSLGLRLLPVLATGAATWFVAETARALGADLPTSFRAAVWYNATITIGAGGIIAAPDAPATFFWIVTLWSLARIWAGADPRWCIAAGLAAGLGCISKYSALFLAPGAVLWLSLTPWGRRQLATPWPWIAAVSAVAVFSTNLAWNAQHHWLTFDKQFGRIAPHQVRPRYFGDFLATQFLLLNPLIAVLAARAVIPAWRGRAAPGAVQLWLPLATSLPFAAYLVLHSLHDRVQAHWPVPLYAGFAILAASAVKPSPGPGWRRFGRRAAIGATLALSGAALAYAALMGPPLGRTDPLLPVRGWSQFADGVEQARLQAGAGWVGTASYGAYAQLAATGRIDAPLLQAAERARYPDVDSRPDTGKPGLLVDLARRMDASDISACFGKVTRLPDLVRGVPGSKTARYALYRVEAPKVDLVAQGCPNDLGKNPAP